MAILQKSLPQNVPGEFFVDSTCIDCDTCRQLAPAVFGDSGDYSFVQLQPRNDEETRQAVRALLSCPTGSIGTLHPHAGREIKKDFPLQLEDALFYPGFNSPKSYGGNSYFLQHAGGNWLIDSPKYLPHLIQSFDELGGIRYIFLTHRDDVAEAHKYAAQFGAERIIHKKELAAQPGAEIVIHGNEPVELLPGFRVIPTPGHTRGHCVLLYQNRFLFTGDHLWWSRERQSLSASQQVCWYSWPEQIRSMALLRDFSFEWVLPGHGQRVKLPPDIMRQKLVELLARMEQS